MKNKIIADADAILASFRKVEQDLRQGEIIDIASLVEQVHDFQNHMMELLSQNPDADIRTQVNTVLSEMGTVYTSISNEYHRMKSEMEMKKRNLNASIAYNAAIRK